MVFEEKRRLRALLVLGLTGFGLVGCTSTPDDSSGSTGTTSSGGASTSGGSDKSDSTVSRGGSSSSSKASSARGGKSSSSSKSSNNTQESGGSVSDGGTDSGGDANSSGGAEPEGSSTTSTGGSTRAQTTTGKSAKGGTSSSSTTKGTGTGGKGTTAAGGTGTGGQGDSSSSKASGGTGAGGNVDSGGATNTSSGGCQKGQVKASEVIIMGESFYAWTGTTIQKRVEENAKKAGAIGSGDSYRNVAISGQGMSVVAGEYDTALKGGAVKVVIMDGGGIDCMRSSCDECPGIFKTLLTKMASNGVQDVIYTRYPEPGNPPGSDANLKKNLDILMPKMEEVCKAATGLRCHWVDLRPVWVNGDTTDGLHPTQSGGNHCGDAIWDKMVKECIAQ